MRTFERWLVAFLVSAAFQLVVAPALAATRTVCFEFQIRDERFDCPTAGTTGAWRPCDPAADYINPLGMIVELWDEDSGDASNDEFIGEWRLGATGTNCITFEWENAPYYKNESHPDLYMKLRPEVMAVNDTTNSRVFAADASYNLAPTITWRDTGVNIENCTGLCSFQHIMIPASNSASDMAQRFMMVDSAQRVLDMYVGDLDSRTILARYPDSSSGCSTGLALARDDFCLPPAMGADGDRVAHEMGHVVQMQMFNEDTLNDVIIGGSWNMTASSVETESGATQEGWGAYVGARAWYDPAVSGTTPFYGSADIGAATPAIASSGSICNSNNALLPLQVAKAFWDLDDIDNETGTRSGVADDDRNNHSTGYMLRNWSRFGDGSGNRQNLESGNDGVNVRDYLFHLSSGNAPETMLELNCLVAQTDT